MGDVVYKNRFIGLDYELLVGKYINKLQLPFLVETLHLEQRKSGPRLALTFVEGESWSNFYKRSSKEEVLVSLMTLLQCVKTLPFTHYDLHLQNILTRSPTDFTIIDFGFSAIPSKEWDPSVKYVESSHLGLSTGIISAVVDPDYDKMLLISALLKSAYHFSLKEVVSTCLEWLRQAEFDHPLFYGYEHFLPLTLLNNYRALFYQNRAPLLSPTRTYTFSELVQGLDQLKEEAVKWLTMEHNYTKEDALLLYKNSSGKEGDLLTKWITEQETVIYDLLYGYKLYRIERRKSPSFEQVLSLIGRVLAG